MRDIRHIGGLVKSGLDVLATVGVIVLSGILIWRTLGDSPSRSITQSGGVPDEEVSLLGAELLGDQRAKAVIIQFSDFECPFCGKFARGTLKELEGKYVKSGQVLMAFRHLPLEIHKNAQLAAESAACAGKQGKFWQMHDELFREPVTLQRAALFSKGEEIGLDPGRFSACLEGATRKSVTDDMAEARRLRVTGTPTFFVGKMQSNGKVKVFRRLAGAETVQKFDEALGSILASK